MSVQLFPKLKSVPHDAALDAEMTPAIKNFKTLAAWLKTKPDSHRMVQMLKREQERTVPRIDLVLRITTRLAGQFKKDILGQVFDDYVKEAAITSTTVKVLRRHPALPKRCKSCDGKGWTNRARCHACRGRKKDARGRRCTVCDFKGFTGEVCQDCSGHGYVCNSCGGSFGEKRTGDMRLCKKCS